MNKIKTLKLNIITAILPWIILAVIGFVKIKFFINIYGDETNGFVQLITQIYGYLSLVEMGFGSAIIYKLYKPLSQGDKESVTKLFNGSKATYKNIAIKLCSMAVIAAFIVPIFFKMESMSKPKMVLIFLIFAVDYFGKYIFDLPYRTLLYADQKKYKANIIINVSTLIVKGVELGLILTGIDYLFVLISNVILNTTSYVIFSKIVKKEYTWLNMTDEKDLTAREMSKDIMGHKIARIAFYGTDNIIISMTKNLGLAATSIYSSYNYIISAIRNILELLFSSPLEILGNKFAKDGSKKGEVESLYNEILSLTYFVGIMTCSVYFVAMNKLAEVWINKGYVLGTFTMIVFSLYIWYECVGRTNLTMIEANGKYKETKWIEYACVVTNITLSFILARYLKIAGVVLATVIAMAFIRHPFQTRFLYKDLFGMKMKKSFIKFIIYTIFMLVMCGLNYFVMTFFNMYGNLNYFTWFLNTFIIIVIDAVLVFGVCYAFDKSFRKGVKRFINRGKKNGEN